MEFAAAAMNKQPNINDLRSEFDEESIDRAKRSIEKGKGDMKLKELLADPDSAAYLEALRRNLVGLDKRRRKSERLVEREKQGRVAKAENTIMLLAGRGMIYSNDAQTLEGALSVVKGAPEATREEFSAKWNEMFFSRMTELTDRMENPLEQKLETLRELMGLAYDWLRARQRKYFEGGAAFAGNKSKSNFVDMTIFTAGPLIKALRDNLGDGFAKKMAVLNELNDSPGSYGRFIGDLNRFVKKFEVLKREAVMMSNGDDRQERTRGDKLQKKMVALESLDDKHAHEVFAALAENLNLIDEGDEAVIMTPGKVWDSPQMTMRKLQAVDESVTAALAKKE
ncbi:TPA: hypothetical protein DF272_06160 [Candidatus Falkowbacteria bacterium]|nr:hypothetical protein [Candidatus Falkowbacteria bacterium]